MDEEENMTEQDGTDVAPEGNPLDSTLWPSVSRPTANPSAFDLPALERERPMRARLIPRWIYGAALAFLAVMVSAAGVIWWMAASAQVMVPQVTGVSLAIAQTRLAQAGLEAQVTDRRFSAAPRDEVLSQTPSGGGTLRRGGVVELIVSAGTDEFLMPDVIGDGLALARGTLEARGLAISVEVVASEEPSDTVLSTTPAPGATVRTGDTVVVVVAAPMGGNAGLRPYDLQGTGVIIDPSPPEGVDSDAAMEVARRLRSLLQASGAEVTMLRSAVDTAPADADRAIAARAATATVSIGLFTDPDGPAGRVVSTPSTGTPDMLQRSNLLASVVTSRLAEVAPPVSTAVSTTESVLNATDDPWVRVRLGSATVREDQMTFTDPRWADRVARAIYSALGEVYGTALQ